MLFSSIKIMKKTNKIYRFFEMIPGAVLWSAFGLAIFFSFIKPIWVIIFIILFDLFWVYRVIYFVFYIIVAWIRFRQTVRKDWMVMVEKLPNWERIHHVIFFPTYKEPLEVLSQSIDSLSEVDYPLDKLIVIVGFEGRVDSSIIEPKIKILHARYGKRFFHFMTTIHPSNIPRELAAKGANANWMGNRFKEWVDQTDLSYDDIVVSYFDCDTQVHKKYFSVLTYAYLTHATPTRSSYQPVALYNNNIWDSPPVMRLAAFSTIFWLMTELMRPERLYTFSSHSMSFRALVDVGFWEVDIVTDDSRIFLQCFIHYNGDYTVTPLFIPVSMDTVLAESRSDSYLALYKQIRRWAWSVEHFPYMMWHFFCEKRQIPFLTKFHYLFNLAEGTFSWAAAPILITILGRLPLWVMNNYHTESIETSSLLVQNAPYVLEKLMVISLVGLVFSAIISLLLLPKKPIRYGYKKYLWMLLQWVLLPITFLLASIPAIDAQTRLLFGKYLGFFVTPKSRR